MNIPMIRMPRANKFGKCMCLSCQKHHDGNGSVEEKWDKNQGKSLRLQLCNRSSKMPNSSNVAKYQNHIFSRAANQIEMTFYATAPWRRESRECRTVPSSAQAPLPHFRDGAGRADKKNIQISGTLQNLVPNKPAAQFSTP